MKKIFTTMMSFALVMSMAVLASCGGVPTNEEVEKIIEKYDDGEDLTPSEYNDLTTYCNAGLDAMVPVVEEVMTAKEDGDRSRLKELKKETEEIADQYEYFMEALKIVCSADDDQLGTAKSDAKKLERRYEKLDKKFRNL